MQTIIDEYYPQYCHSLEAIYGKGMMSEGGSEGIDSMFKNMTIQGKRALDIGSGLGGVAYYLAQKYSMDITGIEINPWMIEESLRNAPKEALDKLQFILHTDNGKLPFENHSFDLVYSKGVLTHVEEKFDLFKECYRVLKPGGMINIIDWLSNKKGEWGPCVQRLVELEGLTLYAETVEGYIHKLSAAEFIDIEAAELSDQYAFYNEEIVRELNIPAKKEAFIQSFNQKLHDEALEGYSSIAKAMRIGENKVVQFIARKGE